MKKQFINLVQVPTRTMLNVFLALSICSSATFFGCQKKEKRIQKEKTASEHRYNPSTTKLASVNVFKENTMAWSDIIRGYSSENTQYRHAKLFLSLGLVEVVKDPVIADWIINEAPMHEDSVFYFEDLFA
uniref:hypothetical protein n=1 Tax=Fluviicola sp. TaxID=1917219 RepID=UPI00260BCEBF